MQTLHRIIVLALFAITLCSATCGSSDAIGNALEESRSGRDKRGIYLNSKAPILIAAFITLPISVAFPALRARSGRSGQERPANGTTAAHSHDDPLYRAQLHKIDAYMDYLGIADDVCRERLLCEISRAPDAHEPLYGVFKKQLSTDFEVAESRSGRFFRYRSAMSEGAKSRSEPNGERCGRLYAACADGVPQMINVSVLRFMQFVTRKFRVQFADTSD